MIGLLMVACRVGAGETTPDFPNRWSWKTVTKDDGLAGNNIWDVLVVEDEVWVASDNGLSRLRDGKWKRWTSDNGFPGRSARTLVMDQVTGDLWIGTWGKGLIRFSAGRFDHYDQINAGLAGNLIFDVAVWQDKVWAATNAGISAINPVSGVWQTHLSRKATEPQIAVTKLVIHKDRLVACAPGSGVFRYDPDAGHWKSLLSDNALDSYMPGEIRDLAQTRDSLWVLGRRSIMRIDNNGRILKHHTLHHELTHADASCFGVRDDEAFWIGTRSGLHIADGNKQWSNYRKRNNDIGGVVELIQQGRKVSTQYTPDSLPDNAVRCVVFADDHVWIGTRNGLVFGTPSGQASSSSMADASAITKKAPGAKTDAPAFQAAGIGFLGPTSRTIAIDGAFGAQRTRADLLALQVTVDLANRSAANGQKPFEMAMQIPGYATYGWGTGEDDFPRFSIQPHVAGLIGFFDPGDHFSSAVAARTEVPVVNAASAIAWDEDERVLPNPWMFQCYGGQPRQHRMMINYLLDHLKKRRLVIIRSVNDVSNRHLDWWSRHAKRRRHVVVDEIPWPLASNDPSDALNRVKKANPDAVLTWCDAKTTARITRALRDHDLHAVVVGGPQIASSSFLAHVGSAPGDMLAMHRSAPRRPNLMVSPAVRAFEEEYAERNLRRTKKNTPDLNAHRSHEATEHLLQAIRVAGSDREQVRQVLELMESSPSGERHYEIRHPNPGLWMARLNNGRWDWELVDVKD